MSRPDWWGYRRPQVTQTMRIAVAERYGCLEGQRLWIECVYCGDPILIDRTRRRVRFLDVYGRSYPELDHVEPLFWGGEHHPDNLVPSCMHCNRSKGARRLA